MTFNSRLVSADEVYGGELNFDKPNGHKRLIVELVGRPGKRVLEIGPAAGQMSAQFQARGCRVWGVEVNPALAAAAVPHCEKVLVADVEHDSFLSELEGGFDYLVCCDVLEHLSDPEKVLRKLTNRLAGGGALVAAVPNIAFLTSRLKIVLGIFDYQSSGIMDQNHLRFFTVRTLKDLVRRAGYRVVEIYPLPFSPRGRRLTKLPGGRSIVPFLIWSLPWVTARLWPGLFAYHLVIKAVPHRVTG